MNPTTKLLNLVDDGLMDAETLLGIIIAGMSETEAQAVIEMPDFEGYGIQDEEEDEDNEDDEEMKFSLFVFNEGATVYTGYDADTSEELLDHVNYMGITEYEIVNNLTGETAETDR